MVNCTVDVDRHAVQVLDTDETASSSDGGDLDDQVSKSP